MASRIIQTSVVLIAILLSFNLYALTVVECEDEQGNRTFQKVCPPESTQVGEKRLKTGKAESDSRSSNAEIKATLYVIPECVACDEVREFLNTRNIPVTEKDVNEDIELQNELTDIAGSLKVPTTVIGEEVLIGYSRTKFLKALESAGYKAEDS